MSKTKAIKYFIITVPFIFSLSVWISSQNWLPALIYTTLSIITYVFYKFDKKRAINDGQRVKESTLHLLELFGGWPGGLLAQMKINHKCTKKVYQVAFWIIVTLHIAGWIEAEFFDWSHFKSHVGQEKVIKNID
ncbi:MAG: DUF1294 domain-containing protein [Lentisphaeria bacterium]|nr:DUF1294 domain-containing protein [Lentisphaeria bacterium]